MKKIIKLSGIILLIIYSFTGCDLFTGTQAEPISPGDRLTQFEANLNTDSRANTYEHIHSGAQIYEQIKEPDWWDNFFSADYYNFDFTNISIGTAVNGLITASAIVSNNLTNWETSITFKEETAGDEIWFIYSITLDPNGTDVSNPGPFDIIY